MIRLPEESSEYGRLKNRGSFDDRLRASMGLVYELLRRPRNRPYLALVVLKQSKSQFCYILVWRSHGSVTFKARSRQKRQKLRLRSLGRKPKAGNMFLGRKRQYYC